MRRNVVVVGSLNLDLAVRVPRLPRPGETVLGGSAHRAPGGKGANQAVAAARLGASVRLAGLVGADAFGQELRDAVAAEGVDVSAVVVDPEATTGMALMAVESGGENMITVAAGANALLGPDHLDLPALLDNADALLLQLEIPLRTCLAAAQAARSRGVTVLVNAAPSPPASPELTRLLRTTDVLVVNETEATALVGSPDPERLLSLGLTTAVVTLGERGAVAANSRGDAIRVDGFEVASVDAVGAGDAFCGQLACAVDEPFAEAVRRACAAGALATTAHGAQAALPTREAVEALYQHFGQTT